MFERLLIANRGEIAVRIARTARRLGIATVAVYSEADREAPHVRAADAAWGVGPAPAARSYLDAERLLDVARRSGAQAVHPGYGFLSENADFAAACAAAGLVFVGPPATAIREMGSKSAAKARMQAAGVPVVPGYHGDDQDDARLARAADEIGFPVLIKAVSGGGGKGMRRVERAPDFADALAGARREALAAFGDDRVLLERWVTRPRHVEVQVFSDTHGHHVHLFERDCSLQRRHQKVLEEAPAPGLPDATRRALGEAAVAAARAIDYVGAGTVEFLLDPADPKDPEFWFMEMNTRLQVEHPVTEAITGVDLVEWQLRVAAGEALPCAQDEIRATGHAFEARLYAEDPQRDFLPSPGRLARWHVPEAEHVRVDSGVCEGDVVSPHYDPMLAKLITWGEDRAAALARLRAALGRCEIAGPRTNLGFLRASAGHPAFAAAAVHTGFLAEHAGDLANDAPVDLGRALVVATLDEIERRRRARIEAETRSGQPASPWATLGAFRLHTVGVERVRWRVDGRTEPVTVAVERQADRYRLRVGDAVHEARVLADGALELDGRRVAPDVYDGDDAGERWVIADGVALRLDLEREEAAAAEQAGSGGAVRAPMPGSVLRVLVSAGDAVTRDQPLLILEAMKMEHTLRAEVDGTVAELSCAAGDQVADGATLLVLRAGDEQGETT